MDFEVPDEVIVDRVVKGNVSLFSLLIERYQHHIFSIGMRFFQNQDDAGDFTQEVFLRVYEKLSLFQQRASFRTWLSTIAYNHGINRSKKHKVALSESFELTDPSPSPEENHQQDEARKALLKAIQDLPCNYQVCLDFYFFMGLSYREISEVTGINAITIRSHVHRAKALLRDMLKGTEADYSEV